MFKILCKIIFFHLGLSLGGQYEMDKHIQGGLNVIFAVVLAFFAMNIYIKSYDAAFILGISLVIISIFGALFVRTIEDK